MDCLSSSFMALALAVAALAHRSGVSLTQVFYMGLKLLDQICAKLRQNSDLDLKDGQCSRAVTSFDMPLYKLYIGVLLHHGMIIDLPLRYPS